MENNKVRQAKKNEVGYCGDYCRTCHLYTDAIRKPAAQLLELVKNHFEVAMWINVDLMRKVAEGQKKKGKEVTRHERC
ncbi:MAG: hypothetical protein OEZ18_04395 [Candidatus Bathyarchaeota archaeon]|jgi:hypothetical protein|nr:hypothetical protein [Candidatus Bathyarchaeota archaeon]